MRWIAAGLSACLLSLPVIAQAQMVGADPLGTGLARTVTGSARFRALLDAELQKISRRNSVVPGPSATELSRVNSFRPWWRTETRKTMEGEPGRTLPASLAFFYDSGILNSRQIRVFADVPAIRDQGVAEVDGRYTTRAYAEGRIANTNDPTTSVAQTRGSERLIQRQRTFEVGLRQTALPGTEITVGQRFISLNTNSIDYLPGNQTTSRTFISIVQPLLRRGGMEYGRSLHEVARLDALAANAEFRRQVDNQLMEIARSYWTLSLARVIYAQKTRLVAQTRDLAGTINGRQGLDTDEAQIGRAQAALALREADLIRARTAIRNAELKLRALVNDPRFDKENVGEIIPVDPPLDQYDPTNLAPLMQTVVNDRPEMQQIFALQQSAMVREGVARNENLPQLDLVMEGNVGGRSFGLSRYGSSFDNSFDGVARPGGVFGLRVEVPLGPNDASARLQQRQLETRQTENQGLATLSTIVLEVEVALNEYRVAFRDRSARITAVQAAQTDVRITSERWRQNLSGPEGGGAILLDRLLDAQDRLQYAEERLAEAESTTTVAFVNLQRASGGLMKVERIGVAHVQDAAGGPAYVLRRENGAAPPPPPPPAQPGARR